MGAGYISKKQPVPYYSPAGISGTTWDRKGNVVFSGEMD
jgi:hypothetical protein